MAEKMALQVNRNESKYLTKIAGKMKDDDIACKT